MKPFASVRDPLEGTNYRFIRHIGSGAMGEVVQAEHLGLAKLVAVKLLRSGWAHDATWSDRFRLEYQALASLNQHRNIVQVFDSGETPDGRPFFVMEWLEGRTLRQETAKSGPFPVEEAIRLVRQVLSGLQEAHAAGVVHRDIKPANLFLCKGAEGIVKILDFGVAKLVGRPGEARRPAPLAVPTTEGVTVGTPRFLAPEQALGEAVDGRTDLYATAAVLYWMIAGKDPFHEHGDGANVMRAHVSIQPRPPSAIAEQPIPPALDGVILKALAKRPDDRQATVAQFASELEGALRGPPEPPRWLVTERMDTSTFRAARPIAPELEDALKQPPVPPRWLVTERMDASMFHRAKPGPVAHATVEVPSLTFRETTTMRPWRGEGAPEISSVCPSPMRLGPPPPSDRPRVSSEMQEVRARGRWSPAAVAMIVIMGILVLVELFVIAVRRGIIVL